MTDYVIVIGCAVLALILALGLYLRNASIKVTNPRMEEIAGYISEGAMAYLRRQYSILAVFIVVMFAVLSHRRAWLGNGRMFCRRRSVFHRSRFLRDEDPRPRATCAPHKALPRA